jgi:hypothetical protein
MIGAIGWVAGVGAEFQVANRFISHYLLISALRMTLV